MGFIKNMLGKSLFTEESYKGAIGKNSTDSKFGFLPGYSCIMLKPTIKRIKQDQKEPSVIGIIKGNLELNYQASWEPLGSLSNIVQSIPLIGGGAAGLVGTAEGAGTRLSTLAGGAAIGSVFASKLVYQKSGYLQINPSFRIVDWKGNADPLKGAFLIASFCTPFESNSNIFDDILNLLKDWTEDSPEQIQKVVELLNQGVGLTADAITYLKENLKQLGDKAGVGQPVENIFNNIMQEVEEDYLSIRSAPVPLEVVIGQYFHHYDMVLTNANLSFSKEMTKNGPLYVDVNLQLTSRKIIGGTDDIGFQSRVSKQRYFEESDEKATRNYATKE